MEPNMHRRGASAGGTKIIILIIIALAASIFVASKLGPIYQTKWDMEDHMEDLMRRMHTLGEEGIFDNLQVYVDSKNLNFNVYDNCTFEGEVEEPGKMECIYDVKLGLPKYETYRVKALVTVPKIPVFSN